MAFLVVLGAGIGSFVVLRNNPIVEEPSQGESAATTVTTTTAQTAVETPELVSVALGEMLLYYPTGLPKDLALCEEVQNRPTYRVVACGSSADGAERRIEVGLRRSETLLGEGAPVEDRVGWRQREADTELVIEIPVAQTWGLQIRGQDVALETLVAVADSIPVIGDRERLIPPYELPLFLSEVDDADLESLFDPSRDVDVVRDAPGNAFVIVDSADDNRMSVHIGEHAQSTDLVTAVGELTRARLVDESPRPMLVGEIANDQTQVWWIQRGLLWSLTTGADPQYAVDQALALTAAFDRLP
ncbi:MAG: hypothetical protein OES13_06580 [Acidimicrobiia bacterium]|nr:hypothetical protein [Acidimicrobiia bacterium]